jgi:phenylpyruvate tautomerase PptA (4-oxalocrotonate tautomerase family)
MIEVIRAYSADEERAIIEAVQAALVEALKIPAEDRGVRLVVHEPHRVAIPAERTDRYTLVSVDLFAGRSLDAKRNLYRAIVTNLEPLGIPPSEVKILLREIPPEDWGIRGGTPASEVELGFQIEV